MINKYGTRIYEAFAADLAIRKIRRLTLIGEGENSWYDFINAFAEFSSTECDDGRDRLFALSSLAPHNTIKADYTMTMIQVCMSFASTLVRERYFLPALELVENEVFERGLARDQTLPSWVHDLRATTWAARDLDRMVHVRLSPDPTILELDAHYIGKVVKGKISQIVLCQDQLGNAFHYPLQTRVPSTRPSATGDAVFLVKYIRGYYHELVFREQAQTYLEHSLYKFVAKGYGYKDRPEIDIGPEITVYLA